MKNGQVWLFKFTCKAKETQQQQQLQRQQQNFKSHRIWVGCPDVLWARHRFLPNENLLRSSVTSILEVNLTPAVTAFLNKLSCQNTFLTLLEVTFWLNSLFNPTGWFGNQHKLHYQTNGAASWKMRRFHNSGKWGMEVTDRFSRRSWGRSMWWAQRTSAQEAIFKLTITYNLCAPFQPISTLAFLYHALWLVKKIELLLMKTMICSQVCVFPYLINMGCVWICFCVDCIELISSFVILGSHF